MRGIRRGRLAAAVIGVILGAVALGGRANAGEPACGGVRIEDGAQCIVERGDECTDACEQAGIESACAAALKPQCDTVCTEEHVPAIPGCGEDCDAMCLQQCDDGLTVVCNHNCFEECTLICPATCADAEDKEACAATCAATCDQECVTRCGELPPGSSCYDHCRECCGASCSAHTKMNCQRDCQASRWEGCAAQHAASCQSACTEDGAVMCDGQVVATGDAALECAEALSDAGIDVEDRGIIVLDPAPSRCAVSPSGTAGAPLWLLVLLRSRRRRRS